MKIREGLVTNSSSTNFIIISKEELTIDYLYEKLGFNENSILRDYGLQLCKNILNGIGEFYHDTGEDIYTQIKDNFGEKAMKKCNKILKNKKYHLYYGNTDSETDFLTTIFTTAFFEIDSKGFYLNGTNCIW